MKKSFLAVIKDPLISLFLLVSIGISINKNVRINKNFCHVKSVKTDFYVV